MTRPKKQRTIKNPPMFCEFKPSGMPTKYLKPIYLSLDEYEAIRLADYEGMQHEEASECMNISRSTFTRLIEKARHKFSIALIEGAVIVIEGGNIIFEETIHRCLDCNFTFRTKDEKTIKKCKNCDSKNLVNLNDFFLRKKCSKHSDGKGCKWAEKGLCTPMVYKAEDEDEE